LEKELLACSFWACQWINRLNLSKSVCSLPIFYQFSGSNKNWLPYDNGYYCLYAFISGYYFTLGISQQAGKQAQA